MSKIKNLKSSIDWTDIKNKCRRTMGENPTENPPSNKFITDILISEHSPIRLGHISWTWEGIKSWVSVHFARHWLGWDKFVSTQRTDRTGDSRDEKPQSAPVDMDISANIQALINVSRYRLCYKASPETREEMENIKKAIGEIEPQVADVLVPNCIYRCGCPEFTSCGYFKHFITRYHDTDMTDIKDRYKAYNEHFNRPHSSEDT